MYKTIIALSTAVCLTTPTFAAESWTGFYAGIQAGMFDVSSGETNKDTSSLLGVHAGYQHQFDHYVIGAEIDHDGSEITFTGTTFDAETTRFKLRGGYAADAVLWYGVIGVARISDSFVTESGVTLGLGASYKVTNNIILSTEYLRDQVDFSGQDVDVNSLSFRAAYKF